MLNCYEYIKGSHHTWTEIINTADMASPGIIGPCLATDMSKRRQIRVGDGQYSPEGEPPPPQVFGDASIRCVVLWVRSQDVCLEARAIE